MSEKVEEVDRELQRGYTSIYSLLDMIRKIREVEQSVNKKKKKVEQELQRAYMGIFLIRYVSKA